MFQAWAEWLGGAAAGPSPTLDVRRPARPAAAHRAPPTVLVHGAFAGAWCWDPHWLDYLAEHDIHGLAMSLRGHGRSGGDLDRAGIAAYVADVESIIAEVGEPCVLIGHSMGGFLIQRLLERQRHHIAAAVLMAPVPPSGLMGSSLRLFGRDPMLASQLSVMQGLGPGAVDASIARRALFSERVPQSVAASYAPLIQRESQRAIWEMTFGPLPRTTAIRASRVPTLIFAAGQDALFSPAELQRSAVTLGADYHEIPAMGHGMMLEPDWGEVAGRTLEWLAAKGLYQR